MEGQEDPASSVPADVPGRPVARWPIRDVPDDHTVPTPVFKHLKAFSGAHNVLMLMEKWTHLTTIKHFTILATRMRGDAAPTARCGQDQEPGHHLQLPKLRLDVHYMLLASHPKEKYLTRLVYIPPCLTMVTPQSRKEYATSVLDSVANGNGDDFAKNFRISLPSPDVALPRALLAVDVPWLLPPAQTVSGSFAAH